MGLSGSRLNRAMVFAGVVATAVTVAASFLSSHYTRQYRLRSSLGVARQVAAQAESLYGEAREKNEKDPLGWVVLQLSRGEEPRVIRVSRIVRLDRSPASADEREESIFNEGEGYLDFSRRFVFDPATGVRILVAAPYQGFLGTQSRALSDLFLFVCWAAFFAFGFGAFRAWDAKVLTGEGFAESAEDSVISDDSGEFEFPTTALPPSEAAPSMTTAVDSTPAPAPAPEPVAAPAPVIIYSGPDREKLSESLRETARSIKGLFEGTAKFARSLADVNGHVATLRKSLHHSVAEANRDGRRLGEWMDAVRAAETEGMNGVASMAKIREHFLARGFAPDSAEMRALAQMATHYERIARLVHEGRELTEKVRDRVVELELALEPLSADADLAAQACERAFAASGEMDLATVAVQRRIVEHSHVIKSEAKPSLEIAAS